MFYSSVKFSLILATAFFALTAHAAITTFHGLSGNQISVVPNDPGNPGAGSHYEVNIGGAAVTSRTSFLSALTGASQTASLEGFEGFSRSDGVAGDLSSAALGATIRTAAVNFVSDDELVIPSSASSPAAGRFDTTRTGATPAARRYLESIGAVQFDFGTAISAFGFYLTDAEESDPIEILATDTLGHETRIDSLFTGGLVANGVSGSLRFIGFIDDSGVGYSSIRVSGASFVDSQGLDDVVVGRSDGGALPEPSSLAALCSGLIGLVVSSRRRAFISRVARAQAGR